MSPKYKITISISVVLIIIASAITLYIQEQGNFHVITAGEAYRSAQLDKDELTYYIKKYQIRSILNLRGSNPSASWYADELNISRENNVAHYDLALSANSEPRERDILNLMDIFSNAPRPLLIHCKAGADRSGLVAAMWKVVVDKKTKAEAEKQLSILYGHLPCGGTEAMDNFFHKWNPAPVKVSEYQSVGASK